MAHHSRESLRTQHTRSGTKPQCLEQQPCRASRFRRRRHAPSSHAALSPASVALSPSNRAPKPYFVCFLETLAPASMSPPPTSAPGNQRFLRCRLPRLSWNVNGALVSCLAPSRHALPREGLREIHQRASPVCCLKHGTCCRSLIFCIDAMLLARSWCLGDPYVQSILHRHCPAWSASFAKLSREANIHDGILGKPSSCQTCLPPSILTILSFSV